MLRSASSILISDIIEEKRIAPSFPGSGFMRASVTNSRKVIRARRGYRWLFGFLLHSVMAMASSRNDVWLPDVSLHRLIIVCSGPRNHRSIDVRQVCRSC